MRSKADIECTGCGYRGPPVGLRIGYAWYWAPLIMLAQIVPFIPGFMDAMKAKQELPACPKCGQHRGLAPYSGARDADFLAHYTKARDSRARRENAHQLRTLLILIAVFAVLMSIALLGVRFHWWV